MKRFIKSTILCIIFAMLITNFSCGYNVMQANEEAVMKAWADIESQLQRRTDLIPNLVEVVKGYAKHEKETLTAVIEARAKATSIQIRPEMLTDPKAMAAFSRAQGDLSAAISKLMVIIEKYPDLKANEHFRGLQHQLEGTENRIAVARQRYNEAVANFNYSIRKFPYSITNWLFLKLEKKEYFKADETSKTAPKIQF